MIFVYKCFLMCLYRTAYKRYHKARYITCMLQQCLSASHTPESSSTSKQL